MANQAMNTGMQPTDVYGGDEVNSIVLDPGYSSVRAGFAGEDTPKSFVNSHYGEKGTRLVFGDDTIHNPMANLTIRNPMATDGTVEDWDAATQLWEYAITSRLTSFKQAGSKANGEGKDGEIKQEDVEDGEGTMKEHPLIMSETAWNSTKNREKSIEIAMENWGCPAFWLSRNSVLASFAAGKATALVVDVGASTATVQCVHDGLILKKSVQKSPLAGNWINSQIRALFENMRPAVNLVPHYMIAGKTPVDAGLPAQATYRTFDPTPTPSFHALESNRVLDEFKESVVAIHAQPLRSAIPANLNQGATGFEFVSRLPGRVFEMPDGANQMWQGERFHVAEGLFDSNAAVPTSDPVKGATIPEMIRQSLAGTDVDIRPHLLQNIVVTGATTLTEGFANRLNNELQNMYPGQRIKIQAAGLTSERRFGSWIGGSILGSLGTFHQMWISKKEYEENGANIVEKRCK